MKKTALKKRVLLLQEPLVIWYSLGDSNPCHPHDQPGDDYVGDRYAEDVAPPEF